MATTNLFSMTVEPFTKKLEALKSLLAKVEAHAASKQLEWHAPGMQADALLQSRLISDQFPFVRQIQVVCDNAKNGVARLAEIEAPMMEDNEKTIPELQARIDKTLAFLHTITPEQINGKEGISVALSYWGGKSMSGLEYASNYLIPNFYFHLATAYSIMRSNGVAIGKSDFMGPLPLK